MIRIGAFDSEKKKKQIKGKIQRFPRQLVSGVHAATSHLKLKIVLEPREFGIKTYFGVSSLTLTTRLYNQDNVWGSETSTSRPTKKKSKISPGIYFVM